MGLSISVGSLAGFLKIENLDQEEIDDYQKRYQDLNKFLLKRGLSEHFEPEVLPKLPYRGEVIGFSYSCIHFLRRAYAYMRLGELLTPSPEDATTDPILRAEYSRNDLNCHLIDHSDAEGFYIPQEFPKPLIADYDGEILGDVLGSSYGLLRELIEVAPHIGIELENGELGEQQAKILAESEDEHPFNIERMVWFTLYESATKSIKYKSAIRFG